MKKAKKRRVRSPKPKKRQTAAAKPKRKQRLESPSPATSLFSAWSAEPAFDKPSSRDLGNAAEALHNGAPEEALALCRQVLASDPNNVEALNLAGIATFHIGSAVEAVDLLQTAVAIQPAHAETQNNLGNVLAALGRFGEAGTAYRAAIDADPKYADAAFNFGVLMEARGQTAEALASYLRTVDLAPKHAGAHQGLGNVLRSARRLDEAKSSYETALALDPNLPEARTNLAAVLHELGQFEDAVKQCRAALEVSPQLSEAHYNLGIALQELGEYDDAIESYRRVLAREPAHAAAALNIAYAAQQMGRLKEAAETFDRAIEIDRHFEKAYSNYADLKLQQGDPEAALVICNEFLDRHPGNTELLAIKGVVLWDLGLAADARHLSDFARLIRPIQISPPDTYDGLDGFNVALSDHVESHPTLTYAPLSHATREGKHSGELLSEPMGPIADLERIIFDAVADYRRALPDDPNHPLLASPPKEFDLSVWGVVMTAAGHQIPHIHPAAWLSGVYYPKVPDVIQETDGAHTGWIEFGRPPAHYHNRHKPETFAIKPEPGLMVLFPSYVYHHTVPFEGNGTRISIAFDLMPRK